MKFFVCLISGFLLLAAGCHRSPSGHILGKAPAGTPRPVLSVRAGDTPVHVVMTGKMIEKCPQAGCWFYLKDDTGVIKVDTKSAGFVVVNVPLQTELTVAGKVSQEGNEVIVEATGLRY